ncbi:MAG: zinc-ribbon domain-containing protein [Gemmatimonadota bacterium]
MNVRCPSCQSVFRVDPARVPAAGVRARCARCSDTFRVEHPDATATEERVPTAAPTAVPTAVPTAAPTAAPTAESGAAMIETAAAPPTGPPPPSEAPAAPTSPELPRELPGTGTPAAAPPAGTPLAAGSPDTAPRPVFGSRDPDARAKRIARALVSDIVAYHPDRLEQALAAGNLRATFRDEIMKSWEEYAAQVGIETAKGTTHFRDALNDILARGQKLF